MAHKKVLFLITKATWGGAQRYVYDLATHMPEEFRPTVAYGERGKLAQMLEEKGIETRVIPTLGRDIAIVSDISSFFQLLVCLWRVRPDIIHLNSSKAAALGALAARILFVPKIIFTVHGWPFKEKRNAAWRAFIYFVSWFTALFSHATIVVSKEDEIIGRSMRLLAKKIRYIPIGIEPPEFLSREEASASLSISTSEPRIMTIAELTPNKGIRYAIEAVALLKQQNIPIEYFVIGDGEEREPLLRLAQERRVSDRVHFLGFIESAARYFKAFDLFLLPSIKEGMPYVLLEAAAATLPIITTTVVNPDLVDHCEQIRAIPPGNVEAIAEAIKEKVLEREENELFPTSRHFEFSKMLAKTTALYR